MKTRASANAPTNAAAMARPLSNPLTPAAAAGREGADGFMVGAGAEAAVAVARPTGVDAAVGGGGGEATATGAAAPEGTEADGAGILIVGAAVGFGGRLMRTVSFLGCTFAASAGFGGRAPAGILGMFSAIFYIVA